MLGNRGTKSTVGRGFGLSAGGIKSSRTPFDGVTTGIGSDGSLVAEYSKGRSSLDSVLKGSFGLKY